MLPLCPGPSQPPQSGLQPGSSWDPAAGCRPLLGSTPTQPAGPPKFTSSNPALAAACAAVFTPAKHREVGG